MNKKLFLHIKLCCINSRLHGMWSHNGSNLKYDESCIAHDGTNHDI